MAGVAGLERQPLLTTEFNYMKNKKCPYCSKVMIGGRGLANHIRFKHPEVNESKPYITTIDARKAPKLKMTVLNDQDYDHPSKTITHEVLNEVMPEPPYYAILRDFEDAVRADEMKGSTDYPEAIEWDYKRAKKLLALRIHLLMHKAERAEWLERELMS